LNWNLTLSESVVLQKDQIERIKRLGAIVSGNPYYVNMPADKYSEEGIGPERADNIARMGDVERAGISYSYHSDMPMAPSQSPFLMDCAVNRTTVSRRVAGEDQRNSREAALKAVTLEAAYSLRLEITGRQQMRPQTGTLCKTAHVSQHPRSQ
jgi:predicted amidohydrolase YtcJ